MGPRLRRNVALCLVLDAVVAHSSRGIQALGDLLVRYLCQVAGFSGMVCPDTSQAVGLEFNLNRVALRPRGTSLVQHTEEILDMMAVFMSQHICLGERAALSAKARVQ